MEKTKETVEPTAAATPHPPLFCRFERARSSRFSLSFSASSALAATSSASSSSCSACSSSVLEVILARGDSRASLRQGHLRGEAFEVGVRLGVGESVGSNLPCRPLTTCILASASMPLSTTPPPSAPSARPRWCCTGCWWGARRWATRNTRPWRRAPRADRCICRRIRTRENLRTRPRSQPPRGPCTARRNRGSRPSRKSRRSPSRRGRRSAPPRVCRNDSRARGSPRRTAPNTRPTRSTPFFDTSRPIEDAPRRAFREFRGRRTVRGTCRVHRRANDDGDSAGRFREQTTGASALAHSRNVGPSSSPTDSSNVK